MEFNIFTTLKIRERVWQTNFLATAGSSNAFFFVFTTLKNQKKV